MSKTNETEASAGRAVPGRRTFFDPEHVERSVPERPWRSLALIAALALALLTLGWELYWRAHWHEPGDFKNTSALWAQERRKATGDATVIIGSSRIFFGADLNVWEKASGDRPIQLALEGTGPRRFLEDLADDERFSGLVVMDYTGLNIIRSSGRRNDVLDYVREQSPSQRADHWLSKRLEKVFAFIDEQTRPRRMMYLAKLPPRAGQEARVDPHKMKRIDEDRNAEVWRRVMEDAAYREEAKRIWRAANDRIRASLVSGPLAQSMSEEEIAKAIDEIARNVRKIRARGGDVAVVRYPFEGDYMELEGTYFPREKFWDRMIEETGCAGVNFEDYSELQGYDLPEWSHLAPREAERFTATLVPILYAEIERKRAERSARRVGSPGD